MIRLLGILEDKVVIISNDTTLSRFHQIHKETPLRGYYDGLFNYTFIRRALIRISDSIKYHTSNTFPFDALLGLTIDENGEIYTHIHIYNDLGDGFGKSEQVMDFQGLLTNCSNSWFGGDTFLVNAISMFYEQHKAFNPEALFNLLSPTDASSESLTVATIQKDALLASIKMANKGMPLEEISKLWHIETYHRKNEIKMFGIDDVQDFNSQNLSLLTAYHTLPDQGS